jgi:hypothetical protein
MIIAYVLRRRFHRKPILANRTPLEIEAHIIALSLEQPAFGQIRVSNELRKLGLSISPAGRARRLVSETVRGRTSAAFRRSSRPSAKDGAGARNPTGPLPTPRLRLVRRAERKQDEAETDGYLGNVG